MKYVVACIVALLAWSVGAQTPVKPPPETRHYHFKLTKGKGTDVCDAYLARLQKMEFDDLPVCRRPLDDGVDGFSKLNRIWLTDDDMERLNVAVLSFQLNRLVAAPKSRMYRPGPPRASFRFEPRIDIDNDGAPDDVLVWNPDWRDQPACGYSSVGLKNPIPVRSQQMLLLLTADGTSVDTQRSRALLGHPLETPRGIFDPIGESESVFQYRGLFYIDAFYMPDRAGDLDGQRRGEPNLKNTLAVILIKGGSRHQVCELELTDPQDYFQLP